MKSAHDAMMLMVAKGSGASSIKPSLLIPPLPARRVPVPPLLLVPALAPSRSTPSRNGPDQAAKMSQHQALTPGYLLERCGPSTPTAASSSHQAQVYRNSSEAFQMDSSYTKETSSYASNVQGAATTPPAAASGTLRLPRGRVPRGPTSPSHLKMPSTTSTRAREGDPPGTEARSRSGALFDCRGNAQPQTVKPLTERRSSHHRLASATSRPLLTFPQRHSTASEGHLLLRHVLLSCTDHGGCHADLAWIATTRSSRCSPCGNPDDHMQDASSLDSNSDEDGLATPQA